NGALPTVVLPRCALLYVPLCALSPLCVIHREVRVCAAIRNVAAADRARAGLVRTIKKGSVCCPFWCLAARGEHCVSPAAAKFVKRAYFVALPVARAPNFLLNFSTRPAVSMIFCWPV